jgi:hypothetical protein
MPTMRAVHDSNPKLASGAGLLTLALALGAAAGYLIVWSLLGGPHGCGPQPGHSPTGRILDAAPFVLPLAAGAIVLAFGATRGWRRSTLVSAVLTIVLIGGVLEVLVFAVEFLGHRCYQ